MIITRGISASGKSTFAKELCENDDSFVEINRDWIRFNVVKPGSNWSNYKFKKKLEDEVTLIQNQMVMDAYVKDKNVIISDTNLKQSVIDNWIDIANDLGYDVEIIDFPISYEEALRRDNLRYNGVGHNVIYKQYVNLMHSTGEVSLVDSDPLRPNCIICDIDGTLAFNRSARGWYDWDRVGEDDVNAFLARIVRDYFYKRDDVIIVSGRDSVCREITEDWLYRYDIPYDHLYMRREGDSRKDSVVKMEIFNNHIKGKYNIEAVFDDRPQVIRDVWIPLGVPLYTVGNWMEEF